VTVKTHALFSTLLIAALLMAGCEAATDTKPAPLDIRKASQATQDKYNAVGSAVTVASGKSQAAMEGNSPDDSGLLTISYPKDTDGVAVSGTVQYGGTYPKMTMKSNLTFTLTDVTAPLGSSTTAVSGTMTMKGNQVVNITTGKQSGTMVMGGDLTGTDADGVTFHVSMSASANMATGASSGTVTIDGVTYAMDDSAAKRLF